MTAKQKEVLEFIKEFSVQRGYSPSYDEIGRGFGFTSLATVHKHVQNLKRGGFITSQANCGRTLQVVGKCPLCGHGRTRKVRGASA